MIQFHFISMVFNLCLAVTMAQDNIARRPLVLKKEFIQHGKSIYKFPTAVEILQRNPRYDEPDQTPLYNIKFPRQYVRYFCPAETPEEDAALADVLLSKCVFGSSERRNACKKEVEPIAKDANTDCAVGSSNGKLYHIGYEYCYKSQNFDVSRSTSKGGNGKFKNNFLKLMDLCYDHDKKRTIYIRHETHSPQLFENQVMEKLQELTWRTELKTDGYGIFKEDFVEVENIMSSYPDVLDRNALLIRTPITSPFDMVFASGRKAFFHYTNIVLTPPIVVEVMENVFKYIRKSTKELGKLIIYSGVDYTTREEDSKYPDEDTGISNYTPSLLWHLILNQQKTAAIAIILHTSPTTEFRLSKQICQTSICYSNNWMDSTHGGVYDNFRGHMYCCKIDDLVKEMKFKPNESLDLKKVKELKLKKPL